MPELPEITAYIEALDRTVVGHNIAGIRMRSPSLLRTWDPPLSEAEGKRVTGTSRMGKRIVWHLEGDLALVFLGFDLFKESERKRTMGFPLTSVEAKKNSGGK